MNILLDTHIFLWSVTSEKAIPKVARDFIIRADKVYISSVSLWEIAIKAKLGKLSVDIDKLIEIITSSGFQELPLTAQHVLSVDQLPKPSLHKDPFDRMLIAQAISEPLRFLTADKKLQKYSDLVQVV